MEIIKKLQSATSRRAGTFNCFLHNPKMITRSVNPNGDCCFELETSAAHDVGFLTSVVDEATTASSFIKFKKFGVSVNIGVDLLNPISPARTCTLAIKSTLLMDNADENMIQTKCDIFDVTDGKNIHICTGTHLKCHVEKHPIDL